MNVVYLGKIPTCQFGNRLILALDGKYVEINEGRPIEFHAELNEKELVLRASFPRDTLNTDQLKRLTNDK
jgi:hypothetical protein